MLTHATLCDAIQRRLPPQPWALAAWQGGSAAFGRLDERSDVDLVLLVHDAAVLQAFEAVELVLHDLGGVHTRWCVPEPSWHGHSQRFYRLNRAPETLLVDLVVMRASAPERFLEPSRHGTPPVLFDKQGVVTANPIDPAAWAQRIQARVQQLRARHSLFAHFPQKELDRGDALAALHFYQSMLLRPLVELLRIKHCPMRHDFHLRYTRIDLPPQVHSRLQTVTFVADDTELQDRLPQVQGWIDQLLGELQDAQPV